MHITFILPAIGKKKYQKYIKTWKMEPLTIAVLKALTPPDIETSFFDDRIELINYSIKTDLVAITCETYTAKRSYNIANNFKERGIKTVIGGYHATLLPEEVSKNCDAVIVGNAESVWQNIILDYKKNRLKKYLPLGLVETGRGCNFNCEFCSICTYYTSKYYPRPVKDIVTDIVSTGKKFIYFVDDNIVSDQDFALKLCKELKPLNIKWSSQGSLTLAKNPELLKNMKESGCELILIGFESLINKNLKQMNKGWMLKLGDINELVKRIHSFNISIYATFLFGFDHDTKDSFNIALDFSLKHDFYFAAFNHLLAFPGTDLYKRLLNDKRLLSDNWWLDHDYIYGKISFKPKNMGQDELSQYCAETRKKFYKFSSVLKRGLRLLSRDPSLLFYFTYWMQNYNLKKEIDEKLNIPIGENLDEFPK